MELGAAVVMALALSLDGLSAGLAYGWRRILVPWYSLLGMGLVSGAVVGMALALGGGAADLLPVWLAPRLGGLILVAVGVWVLLQQRAHLGSGLDAPQEVEGVNPDPGAGAGVGASAGAGTGAGAGVCTGAGTGDAQFKPWLQIRIGLLGIVIQVLKYPHRADMDASGSISWAESLLLGLALSLDAFGAGFGAAVSGLGGWALLALVPGFQVLMVGLGLTWGRRLGSTQVASWQQWLPGLMLILIGIIRFRPR